MKKIFTFIGKKFDTIAKLIALILLAIICIQLIEANERLRTIDRLMPTIHDTVDVRIFSVRKGVEVPVEVQNKRFDVDVKNDVRVYDAY
jgi:uncharacterized membrane protein YczE